MYAVLMSSELETYITETYTEAYRLVFASREAQYRNHRELFALGIVERMRAADCHGVDLAGIELEVEDEIFTAETKLEQARYDARVRYAIAHRKSLR